MKLNIIPESNPGKWSVILICITPVVFRIGIAFVEFYESVPAGKTPFLDITARPGVAIPMLTGFASGIAAFVCGSIGIIRKRDYSVLAVISSVLGFLILLWVSAQILFPH